MELKTICSKNSVSGNDKDLPWAEKHMRSLNKLFHGNGAKKKEMFLN